MASLCLDCGLWKCPKCKQCKSFDSFGPDKSRKTGIFSYCRSCALEHSQYIETTEKRKNWTKKYLNSGRRLETIKRYQLSAKGQRTLTAYKKSEAYHIAKIKSALKHRRKKRSKTTSRDYQYRHKQLNPKQYEAKNRIAVAIATRKLPKAVTQSCYYCSDKARDWHHWKGYSKKHLLDVIPVCRSCHRVVDQGSVDIKKYLELKNKAINQLL